MLPSALLRFRQPIVFGLHLGLIPLAYFVAYLLRFDGKIPPSYTSLFGYTLAFLLPIRLVSFFAFRLYRGWWRHVGMRDLTDLVLAVTVSSGLFVTALFLTGLLEGLPRSILVLDWMLAIFVVGGTRFAVRGVREYRSSWRGPERRATPALVIGAGEAAERLIRQVRHGGATFRIVGLVDDDLRKKGMRLHGVPVLGATAQLKTLVAQHDVKLLVIAIPSATQEEMKHIVARCMETGVEFKIVPPLHELIDGRARLSQIRSVEVEDLLGRDTVELDMETVRADLAGKAVLVTGAAGSIGSELARQIAGLKPRRLLLLDQAETPLYFIDLDLRRAHPDTDIVSIVADVTHHDRQQIVFREHRPDYVFHAAAYKHVPLMEGNVGEAVKNNVFGTLCVARCAALHGVKKFVLVSTDKAVRPSSVMGATKRIAERIVLGWPELRGAETDFRVVRFGNVLGSDGSVIPLFRKQLARGGPLTVTHPEVTRYFMTIPEAVHLMLQAAALPEVAGHIAMLEMGEPVRIVELAENLIRLSGLEPYRDIPIVFTGLRPGEKLNEELVSDTESTIPTSLHKIRVVQTDEINGLLLQRALDRLAAAVGAGNTNDLLDGLRELVPEGVPPLQHADDVALFASNVRA